LDGSLGRNERCDAARFQFADCGVGQFVRGVLDLQPILHLPMAASLSVQRVKDRLMSFHTQPTLKASQRADVGQWRSNSTRSSRENRGARYALNIGVLFEYGTACKTKSLFDQITKKLIHIFPQPPLGPASVEARFGKYTTPANKIPSSPIGFTPVACVFENYRVHRCSLFGAFIIGREDVYSRWVRAYDFTSPRQKLLGV